MAKEPSNASTPTESEPSAPAQMVCGIVMPIAAMGEEYSEEHWRRVRKILQRAIDRAGMRSQLVWENAEVDVIHSAILQNLYENDVVICDVSGLNPNVMLETGLRLSTKKPTIIVTDRRVKPPFDIGIVGYIDYQPDLEYNATEIFIERLKDKIVAVVQAYKDGGYKSFVENFTFETVIPSTVNVSGEEYLKEQIDSLVSAVRRIESRERLRPPTSSTVKINTTRIRTATIWAVIEGPNAIDVEFALDSMADFGVSTSNQTGESEYTFRIPLANTKLSAEEARSRIVEVLTSHKVDAYSINFN